MGLNWNKVGTPWFNRSPERLSPALAPADDSHKTDILLTRTPGCISFTPSLLTARDSQCITPSPMSLQAQMATRTVCIQVQLAMGALQYAAYSSDYLQSLTQASTTLFSLARGNGSHLPNKSRHYYFILSSNDIYKDSRPLLKRSNTK